MIHRRLPASSSFVLAAARLRALQLDPTCTATGNQAAARKIQKKNRAQPGDTMQKPPGKSSTPS
jgi:hypothetical protein